MRLEGKIAVITGAGSGMGRAMANLFAKEGAKIVVGEWNEKTLAEVVDEVRAAGGEITGVQGNIAVRAQAEAIVDTAVNKYGRLDILVNNAGVMDVNQGVGELTDEMWERVLGINLNGTMFLTRRAVPVMVNQGGGSIINISSIAALGGAAAGAAYTTSKHAIVGLTKNTAWIYQPKGIRCNAICPGGVETNIMQSVDMTKMDPTGSARLGVYYPTMPASLKPMDIAYLALFLASDESRMINGAIIPADAGWRAA
jgi:NAD(P)-dependent dehydrogenase (short-subunit alcohol dehydrogenase family)